MIKEYTYFCKGTCSRQINYKIDTETNKLVDIEIIGGCNGNLKGISTLVKGLSIDEVISKLQGIPCGNKPTSCPDQLAKCLKEIKSKV